MPEKNYRELLLKKIGHIKRITLSILGTCITFIAVGISVLLYYSSRDRNDFTIYMTLFGLFFFIVVGIFINFFFKSYVEVINVMTHQDLEVLEGLSESRWWIEKYLPSFIIYSGQIRIFKLYRQPKLYFIEIDEISIRPNYFSRSRQTKLVIFKKLKGGNCFFSMDSNPVQQKHLLDKAIENNPKIIIKTDIP